MTQLVYIENNLGSRPYQSMQETLTLPPLARFRLSPRAVLRVSRPERVMALALILTLHAVVLTLVTRSPVQPVTFAPQPQPISVELVAAAPAAPPVPEVQPDPVVQAQPEAIILPSEAVEEAKPLNDTALQPAPAEKKVPPVAKKTAAAKPQRVAQPHRAPSLATAQPTAAPSTPSSPHTTSASEAPLSPPLATADYLHNPPPPYPEVAISRGQEGRVLLNVQVRPDGKVQTLNIQKSSGYPALDNAARDTVLRWSFVPARRGNQAVSGWVIVPVDFSLDS